MDTRRMIDGQARRKENAVKPERHEQWLLGVSIAAAGYFTVPEPATIKFCRDATRISRRLQKVLYSRSASQICRCAPFFEEL